MNALRKLVTRFFFSEEFPLDVRMINVLSLIGTLWAFSVLVLRVIEGVSLLIILSTAGFLLLFIITTLVFHITNARATVRALSMVMIMDTVLPFSFFMMGGFNSGIATVFVLVTALIFYVVHGKMRIVILALHFILTILVYLLGYSHPEFVIQHPAPFIVVDTLVGIIASGCTIGTVDLFQDRLYRYERAKVEEEKAEATRFAQELGQARDELIEQERLLSVVNQTTQTFLNPATQDLGVTLKDAMERIGMTLDLDRITILHDEKIDGERKYRVYSSWIREGLDARLNILEGEHYPYFDTWLDTFLRGEVINGLLSSMPSDVQNGLLDYDIRSLLIIPVFQQDEYWGFVSFDDCRTERVFPNDLIDILRSASFMLVSAISLDQTNRQMYSALEAALQASKAKADFLSNMSHEIRTPMNAIIGMTAIARNTDDLERKNESLSKIDHASSHLLGVINDILDMSKIEANKLELSLVDFDFPGMLNRVLEINEFSIRNKGLACEVDIDEAIPSVLVGDDLRLAQVITNLLSNAIKFTATGGLISLKAQLIDNSNEQSTIRVSVSDNGIGISESQQEQLFVSFQQAESGTSRKYGGTGLGLTISKNIIELMGGRIWVESELGHGSTFFFEISLQHGDGMAQKDRLRTGGDAGLNRHGVRSDASDSGSTSRRVSEDSGKNADEGVPFSETLSGREIMLAEDVEVNREIVAAFLEDTGITITMAKDGRDALALFEADPSRYELILMDMQMPEMDGLEATRRIRALETPEARKVPIIAMTANVFREDVEACLASGMDDHIGKPVTSDKLKEILRKYLNRAQ
ncbi:MAG: response regulator [Coriobacteriales bacterium]|jgi:signal transduction histidine kinase/ActR/RegA family two-component response regulator|nr:response regulator [Coriobacteriales bacterium]